LHGIGINMRRFAIVLLLFSTTLSAAPKPHRPTWALFPGFPPPPTQIDLTFQVKGILPLANGGTGLAAVPGTTGQLIFNNGGVYGAEDPIVSGPDAVGVGPTKNPVQIGCLFLTAPATLTNNQVGAVQCDATQHLLVNPGSGTFTVSGTVSVNALPTGSNTIGKVDILGNAGAVMDAAGQNAASPANELLTGCQFNTSPTTITSGNISPVQCDNSGSVNVHITAGAGSGGTALADKATFTEGTTQLTPIGGEFNSSSSNLTTGQAGIARMTNDRNLMSDVEKFGGTAISTGTGTGGAGIPRVTVSSDSFPATQAVSGTVTANQGGAPWSVVGTLTNNNAAPGANNVGVLPARAETSAPSYTTGNQALLSEDLSGNLRVSLTGTNTISGTVTANAGTNLNTSALQLDATGAKLNNAQGSTTSGETGPLMQGAVTTSAPSYTTAQTSPLSLNTSGGLRVDGSGVTQPVSGTITANAGTGQFNVTCTAANCPMNVAQFGGSNVVTGTGGGGAGIPRVTVSNDSTIAAIGASTPSDAFANPTTAQISQGFMMGWNGATWDRIAAEGSNADADPSDSLGDLSVHSHAFIFNGTNYDRFRSAGIGNNVASTGIAAAGLYGQFNTVLPSLQSGNFSAGQMDANGRLFTSDSQTQALLAAMYVTATKPGVSNASFIRGTFGRPITSTGDALDVNIKSATTLLAVPSASASYALTPFRNGAVTTAVTVKGAPGNLWAWFVYNPNASACFLDFFNTTSPTLGTTVPVWTISLPATSAANVPPGQFAFVNFNAAWSVAAVTATGGASTCATGVVVSLSIF
jgi:hypothetical protein